MVDSSKRRSLKSLSAMMSWPLIPATAIAANAHATVTHVDASETNAALNKTNGNEELSISLILGDKPMMRVTNNTDSVSILRRVHPGVVHAGANTFDLNHALSSSAYAIGAGRSRLIPIEQASSSSANYTHYSSTKGLPLRLASISSDNKEGRILDSSRIFIA